MRNEIDEERRGRRSDIDATRRTRRNEANLFYTV
jgi:hypothetical protein